MDIQKTVTNISSLQQKNWALHLKIFLFFDDALYAIERAKKNGFKVVAVQDDSNDDHDEIIRECGDHYITDFSQIDIDGWFFAE